MLWYNRPNWVDYTTESGARKTSCAKLALPAIAPLKIVAHLGLLKRVNTHIVAAVGCQHSACANGPLSHIHLSNTPTFRSSSPINTRGIISQPPKGGDANTI